MVMARYPASVRLWQYMYLSERDGELCAVCGKGPEEVRLEIDHVDGDPNNNAPENIRFLCHRCNLKELWKRIKAKIKTQPSEKPPISELLSPSASMSGGGAEREIITKHDLSNADLPPEAIQKIACERDENVSEIRSVEGRRSERMLDVYRESPELRISREKEPEFRRKCLEYVLRAEGFTVHQAIYELAEEISLSPITCRRYLEKLTSAVGPLKIGESGPRGHQVLLLREEYWEKIA